MVITYVHNTVYDFLILILFIISNALPQFLSLFNLVQFGYCIRISSIDVNALLQLAYDLFVVDSIYYLLLFFVMIYTFYNDNLVFFRLMMVVLQPKSISLLI